MLRSAIHKATGSVHLIEIESVNLDEYTIVLNAGEGNRVTPNDDKWLSTREDEESLILQKAEMAKEEKKIEKAVSENKRRKGEIEAN